MDFKSPQGATFEIEVPEEHEDQVERFMEQLAMDNITDPNEIQRRVETFMEQLAMDDPYALDDGDEDY